MTEGKDIERRCGGMSGDASPKYGYNHIESSSAKMEESLSLLLLTTLADYNDC